MATETATQIVREAPEIEAYKLGLLSTAKSLADKPVSLPNYQVAGMTPYQSLAIQGGASGIGAYKPYIQQGAESMGTGVAGTQIAMEAARGALPGATAGFDPNQVQGFMNPYQQQVIDESMRQIQRQGDIARQNLQAQATRSGAFGGYREGVQRSELDRGLAEQKNAAITGALSSGYQQSMNQAMAAFEAQKQRQMALAGGLGSLSGQLANIGGQQASLGGMEQQLGQQDVNFLYNLGSQQQGQSQRELDALRSSQMQTAYEPYQRVAFLSDIYKGAPSTQMAFTQSAQPSPSPFQQITGTLVGGAATAKALQGVGGLL